MTPDTDIFTKIRGISQYQSAVRWCKPGTQLQLVREPANPYDRNAIAVYVFGGTLSKKLRQVGYLSEDLAERFASHVDLGLDLTAIVLEPTGKRGQAQGVNILLSYPKEQRKAIERKIAAERARERAIRSAQAKQLANEKAELQRLNAERKEANRNRRIQQAKQAAEAASKASKLGLVKMKKLVKICYGIEDRPKEPENS